MKILTIVFGFIVTTLLAGCGGLQTSGGTLSEEEKPYSQRVFNPEDPYHGG